MNEKLEHFINLIAKTGDKLLVYDRHNPDNSFVVVSMNEYERLTATTDTVKGLTEDELIDKINRDIAIWKNGQVQGSEFSDFSQEYTENQVTEEPEVPQSWSPPKPSFDSQPPKNNWTIPESRRREADSTS